MQHLLYWITYITLTVLVLNMKRCKASIHSKIFRLDINQKLINKAIFFWF